MPTSWLDLLHCGWTLMSCWLASLLWCPLLTAPVPSPTAVSSFSQPTLFHVSLPLPDTARFQVQKPFVWFRAKTDKGIVCLAGHPHSVTEAITKNDQSIRLIKWKRLLSNIYSHLSIKNTLKFWSINFQRKWFSSRVCLYVELKRGLIWKCWFTEITRKWFLSNVCLHVAFKWLSLFLQLFRSFLETVHWYNTIKGQVKNVCKQKPLLASSGLAAAS